MADYTDAAAVAADLDLAPDTQLAAPVAAGATTLSVASTTLAGGRTLYVGMSLALDQFNPAVREVVQVTGAATGGGPYTVPVTPVANAHPAGAPVRECSTLVPVVTAACRLVDDLCRQPPQAFGPGPQTLTETVEGFPLPDGSVRLLASGRNLQSIQSATWVVDPATDQPQPVTSFRLDDYVVTVYGVALFPVFKRALFTLTYTYGFAPIPADITRAGTVLAARLWKERESGYADVVGTAETGILQYKRGVPKEVELLLARWKRVWV